MNSTILIIIIAVVFLMIGICSVFCHFIDDYGRSFDASPAPVLRPRALGGKSCSCHEDFQGTCKDCLFVVQNGHGHVGPDFGAGDKGFGDSPTDPLRGLVGTPPGNSQIQPITEETIPLMTNTDSILIP